MYSGVAVDIIQGKSRNMLAFLSSSMLMLKFNRAVPLSWNTRHHLRSNEAAGFNIIFQKSINLIRLPFLRVKSHLCCEGDEWVEINKGSFFGRKCQQFKQNPQMCLQVHLRLEVGAHTYTAVLVRSYLTWAS